MSAQFEEQKWLLNNRGLIRTLKVQDDMMPVSITATNIIQLPLFRSWTNIKTMKKTKKQTADELTPNQNMTN